MFLEAVRSIVDPRWVSTGSRTTPLTLTEESATSRCPPLCIREDGAHWALRLQSNHHLPILAQLPKERSVRRLPDYILFSASPTTRSVPAGLRVTICELKSSDAGVDAAKPQLRAGKLLTDYLLYIAAHTLGTAVVPKVWFCGLIISTRIPGNMIPKGRTRGGKVELPSFRDDLADMEIFVTDAKADLRLSSLY